MAFLHSLSLAPITIGCVFKEEGVRNATKLSVADCTKAFTTGINNALYGIQLLFGRVLEKKMA